MSERAGFIAAIAAKPNDDFPKLVFADWLEERGEQREAHLLRKGYWELPAMARLIGANVRGVSVSPGEEVLAFDTDRGVIAFGTEGDCCSETWFADLNGAENIRGETVLSVETVNMDGYNVNDGRTRQESDEAYGYRLHTRRGTCDVVLRNSSNGYYGGRITDHAGDLPPNMKPITQNDWRA